MTARASAGASRPAWSRWAWPIRPTQGGYSKLFAFLRSLQTPEERSSAGYVTGKALSMARLAALIAFCA